MLTLSISMVHIYGREEITANGNVGMRVPNVWYILDCLSSLLSLAILKVEAALVLFLWKLKLQLYIVMQLLQEFAIDEASEFSVEAPGKPRTKKLSNPDENGHWQWFPCWFVCRIPQVAKSRVTSYNTRFIDKNYKAFVSNCLWHIRLRYSIQVSYIL